MEKGKLKQVEVEIPILDFIPECLKDIDELKFFTLIDEGLDKTEKQVASQLFRLTRTALLFSLVRQRRLVVMTKMKGMTITFLGKLNYSTTI